MTQEEINHRELLKKYMTLIIDIEGYDFIKHIDSSFASIKFTQEEISELVDISNSIIK